MKTSVAAVLILAAFGATLADVLFQEKFDDGELTNTGVALLAGGGWWGGGGGVVVADTSSESVRGTVFGGS
jgi:hypothetical protein